MRLYIIRHGETKLNALGCLQGWTDEPLNKSGRDLAVITSEALKEVPFDLVITSPLKRARETGELAVATSETFFGKKVPVIEDRRLMEFNWGSWEGLCCLESNFEIPDPNYNSFYTDPFQYQGAPDGESVADVMKRTADFFNELIHNPAYEDKTILIATHGCALRAMLNPLYENKDSFWQERVPYNCAVTIIDVKEGQAKIIDKDRIYYDESLCFDHYKVVSDNVKS